MSSACTNPVLYGYLNTNFKKVSLKSEPIRSFLNGSILGTHVLEVNQPEVEDMFDISSVMVGL